MKQWNNHHKTDSNRKKALLLKVTGRVQGVCFRAETKRQADARGITGWVRNCDDGSVEIFAQGEEEDLQNLEGWCAEGPSGAEVERVEKTEEEIVKNAKEFEIRH